VDRDVRCKVAEGISVKTVKKLGSSIKELVRMADSEEGGN
jgi:hypothetical protein